MSSIINLTLVKKFLVNKNKLLTKYVNRKYKYSIHSVGRCHKCAIRIQIKCA